MSEMTPLLYPYDGQDTAADWHPVTDDGLKEWWDMPLTTYGEWLDERRARGIPGGLPETYHRECNHHGPIWTGETCPACGAIVWERRDGRIDCHVCEVWWTGRDELDAAAAAMLAAADETTE